ncbi:aldose 1-epimerase [Cohnella hongkongensis]|uniref:Aldose 1-epimerase n=1 Tax=Cohnella hongkongensis TaxID=178337 RepID=A0ABV9F7Y4_9BACL
MSRYRVHRSTIDGAMRIALRDEAADTCAELIPSIGSNVIRFASGGREALMPPDSVASLAEGDAVYRYGVPILFPPNRVKNGAFAFKGRTYRLPINEPPDHHLHGELCSRAWEVTDAGATEDLGAYAVSRFRYADHPDMMAYFPHPLTFTITYSVREGALRMSGTIANEGSDDAPFAFGLHPYFRVPYAEGERIELQAPAALEWPVTNLAFVNGKPEETAFSRALNEGVSIAGYPALGCSLLSMREGDSTCRLRLPDRGYAIAFRFGAVFSHAVLFRPDWCSAFSIEPYTSVTDAFNVAFGSERTGARGIAPGETIPFFAEYRIETE